MINVLLRLTMKSDIILSVKILIYGLTIYNNSMKLKWNITHLKLLKMITLIAIVLGRVGFKT